MPATGERTVLLPSTFSNSFWSAPEYRHGLEVIYRKLEQGIAEDEEILHFVRARISSSIAHADALSKPPHPSAKGTGFSADDGASLLFAFKGLQAQMVDEGQQQLRVANALVDLVEKPFTKWSGEHKSRILESKKVVLNGWVESYEQQKEDLVDFKRDYDTKTREADLLTEEAKFAAPSISGQSIAFSPASTSLSTPVSATGPTLGGGTNLRRSGTLAQRLASVISPSSKAPTPPPKEQKEEPPVFEAEKDVFSPPVDAEEKTQNLLDQPPPSSDPPAPPAKPSLNIDATAASAMLTKPSSSPQPASSQYLLLAGLSISPEAATSLLAKARHSLPQHSVKLPLIGDYEGCFTGAELTVFLNGEVEGLGGIEQANQAGRELVEVWGLVQRVSPVGRSTWGGGEGEWYQFSAKEFNPSSETLRQQLSYPASPASPVSGNGPSFNSLLSRSTSILASALGTSAQLPAHVRQRKEALLAEQVYREAVQKLDRTRCRMEEVIEEGLKTLQRWEGDRLRAVKTVLKEYIRITSAYIKNMQNQIDPASILFESFVPNNDLSALISRYRTGPFRPTVTVFEPLDKNMSQTVFGLDLRRWAFGTRWVLPKEEGTSSLAMVPGPLRAMLERLDDGYADMKSFEERRKIWIYEVPLNTVHSLRAVLVEAGPNPPKKVLDRDLPIVAATLKLWLLEMALPLGPHYQDVRSIYTSSSFDDSKKKVEEIKTVLSRLPKIHLITLDAVVSHLRSLYDATKVVGEEDEDNTYLIKLGISFGRSLIRPEHETSLTIQERSPANFLSDMIRFYSETFPQVISERRKQIEAERLQPQRKNTRPVDKRTSRSSMNSDELASLTSSMLAGGGTKSPSSSTFFNPPASPKRSPVVYQNENAARFEDEAAALAAAEEKKAKEKEKARASLGKLRTGSTNDEPLPDGFVVQPPTPSTPGDRGVKAAGEGSPKSPTPAPRRLQENIEQPESTNGVDPPSPTPEVQPPSASASTPELSPPSVGGGPETFFTPATEIVSPYETTFNAATASATYSSSPLASNPPSEPDSASNTSPATEEPIDDGRDQPFVPPPSSPTDTITGSAPDRPFVPPSDSNDSGFDRPFVPPTSDDEGGDSGFTSRRLVDDEDAPIAVPTSLSKRSSIERSRPVRVGGPRGARTRDSSGASFASKVG